MDQIQGKPFIDVHDNLNVHNGDVFNTHDPKVSVDQSETDEWGFHHPYDIPKSRFSLAGALRVDLPWRCL